MSSTDRSPPEASASRQSAEVSGIVNAKVIILGYAYSNQNGYPADNPFMQLRQPSPDSTGADVVFTIWSSPSASSPRPVVRFGQLLGAETNPSIFSWLVDLSKQNKALTAIYSLSADGNTFQLTIQQTDK